MRSTPEVRRVEQGACVTDEHALRPRRELLQNAAGGDVLVANVATRATEKPDLVAAAWLAGG